MNIKFLIKGFEDKKGEREKWEKLISKLLATYIQDLGLSPNYLYDFIIAEESQYEKGLKIHQEIRKHTHNDSHHKYIKVILHKKGNGETCASLVVRREVMEEILTAVKSEKKEWVYNELLYRYLLFHELGHCLDYQNRFALSQERELDMKTFKLKSLFHFFSGILLDEFAACAITSKVMTTGVFHNEINAASDIARQKLDELESIKDNYNGQPKQLFELAMTSASTFWLILIPYVKLMGNKIDNKNISKFRMKVWKNGSPKIGVLLNELGKNMWELWKKYPKWDNVDLDFLYKIWNLLALENGFRFMESPEGDGVYWR